MFKKAIPFILFLSLLFGINVSAQSTDSQNNGAFAFPETPQNFHREAFERPSDENRLPSSDDQRTQTSPSEGNPGRFNMPDMSQFSGQMPNGMGGFPGNIGVFPGSMQNNTQSTPAEQTGFLHFIKTYSSPIISGILLIFAFIFVTFYKRKKF